MPLPEHLARATVGASRGRTVPQALRGGTFLNREHIRHKNQKNGTLSSPVPCMSILEATPTISKPWQCRLVHRNNADIATPGDPGCTAGSHGAINSWSATSPDHVRTSSSFIFISALLRSRGPVGSTWSSFTFMSALLRSRGPVRSTSTLNY